MYLDLYFLLNLAVNYWLLLVMAKLLFREPGFLRLIGGAAMGAGLALLVVCSPGTWFHPLALLVLPAAMLLLVFWPLPWRVAAISWLVFFLLAFLTGGIAGALQELAPNAGNPERRLPLLFLLVAGLILRLIPSRVRPFLKERKWQHRLTLKLLVRWRGKDIVISGLLDTGNRLRDPVQQRPVIIVDFQSVAELLPPEINRRLEDPRVESWRILEGLQEDPLARSFILIPYRGLGAGEQLMLGFSPAEIILMSEYQYRSLRSGVVLGLYRQGFGDTARYQALLPPELIGPVEKWGGPVGTAFNQA